ncbi:MAG: glycine--tRNA ligase subunit beta [Nitrospira sp. SB0677_bin_15]|nr:glycine--tRNA ligase subunit beta [Nitrospira sp. SB0677_bin_15]MYH01278.1 glycine--tRNA ligase subunit beta [Nitrospira sp. SB0675_bin_23]
MPTTNLKSNRPPTTSFLLEIGSEELPWQMIQPAMTQLAQLLEGFLANRRLAHDRIRTFGTPRRLAILVEGLAFKQTSTLREALGPSKAAAFDARGRPTKAAEGFAKSQGVGVGALETRQTPKGVYLCAVKQEKGLPAATVLTEHLPNLLQQLTFSKTMRWNASGVRYPRPIRWVVALVGARALSFDFAGVRSGARSWGHRFLSGATSGAVASQGIKIPRPEMYEAVLAKSGVVVDSTQRREVLAGQLTQLARSAKGRVYQVNYEELLDQAVFSLECPNVVCGTFDRTYLAVPQEVLIASMAEHQGFFSAVDRKGELLPRFFAPTNVNVRNMELIRVGNERVLAARLADARYFFDEDCKVKLADRVRELHGVVFHKKLGSLYDKTQRMIDLVGDLAEAARVPQKMALCRRAALLCKADLVTGMVGEFPMLQGVMGEHYAAHDGESVEVCQAIGECYRPRTPDDAIPETTVGRLLSLADRLDTLAAFFHAGIVPSGSEDPFGLRRSAFGVIRIVIEAGLNLNMADVLRQAEQRLAQQGVKAGGHPFATLRAGSGPPLRQFLEDRLRYYGRVVAGYREDVMDSVLARADDAACNLRDLFLRMDALQAITSQQDFESLIVGFKRAHRIVEKEAWTARTVDVALLTHSTEWTLQQVVETAGRAVGQALGAHDYHGALKHLIELKNPIDQFFDGVLVNAPETEVRANRLSLLRQVDDLFSAFGDLSQIQVQGQ